jgi:hypothetical protein
MTSKPTNRDALHRLTVALVEDILNASDEDILAEARQEHPSAAKTRALFERAAAQAAKGRIVAARSAAANDRSRPASRIPLDPAEARRRVERILAQDPNLTLAARKGQGSSDDDIKSLLEDLKELGLASDTDET